MIQGMRKKSHIILASFIADNLKANGVDDLNLQQNRPAFIIGSLLPDCKPSFLIEKHSYDVKSEDIEKAIRRLTDGYSESVMPGANYWKNLGEVIHFIADFFTAPHNSNFTGNMKEHCTFEGELKRTLKSRIRAGMADCYCYKDVRFQSSEELIGFLREYHAEYMTRERNIDDSIAYIASITYLVAQGVILLIEPKIRTAGNGAA
jgi:hypothetical protein